MSSYIFLLQKNLVLLLLHFIFHQHLCDSGWALSFFFISLTNLIQNSTYIWNFCKVVDTLIQFEEIFGMGTLSQTVENLIFEIVVRAFFFHFFGIFPSNARVWLEKNIEFYVFGFHTSYCPKFYIFFPDFQVHILFKKVEKISNVINQNLGPIFLDQNLTKKGNSPRPHVQLCQFVKKSFYTKLIFTSYELPVFLVPIHM